MHKRHNVHTWASSGDTIFTTASNSFHLKTTTIAGAHRRWQKNSPPARPCARATAESQGLLYHARRSNDPSPVKSWMAGVHRQSPRRVFIHSFGFPSHVYTNLGPAAQQSQIRDKVDHSQQHKTKMTTIKGKEEDTTHVVYNANAIPIPWIRPAWPRVARHFTRLATARSQDRW